MTVLRHAPGAEKIADQVYRPVCGCGWRGKELPRKEAGAVAIAEQHARRKGCGKFRFPSEQAAKDALLRARIARGLRGNLRRREQRAYPCPDCPGNVWHLTSRGER